VDEIFEVDTYTSLVEGKGGLFLSEQVCGEF
jgi:hypothetical protein